MSSATFVPTDFGERLRSMRERQDMSQRKLADALDGVISQPGIARLENGQKQPSASELLALSWVLGVSIEDLTDEVPLSDRVTWAARSTKVVDTSEAVRALTAQLQLRNTLQKV